MMIKKKANPTMPKRQEQQEQIGVESGGQPADKKAPPVETANEPVAAAEATAQQQPAEKKEELSVEELTTHLQRLAAEFDNFRKRTSRELQTARENGMAKVMEAILPVLDSFDRSLSGDSEGRDAAAWREGLVKIHRQLKETLEKQGLRSIEAKAGDRLDPYIHEVMLTRASPEVPPGSILDVIEVGYKMADRLLRPAKVQVAVAAPAERVN